MASVQRMDLCLMIEGQEGVTWPQWVALAGACEKHGVPALFRSDHYLELGGEHPERGALDAWTTLAALGALTTGLRLGTLVSPVTFRHPSVLAKAVATADHVSEGRVELGLGAGWHALEHEAYGFAFPPPRERMDILEEQLLVQDVHPLARRRGEPVGLVLEGVPAGAEAELDPAFGRGAVATAFASTEGWRNVTGDTAASPGAAPSSGRPARRASSRHRAPRARGARRRLPGSDGTEDGAGDAVLLAGAGQRDPLRPGDALLALDHEAEVHALDTSHRPGAAAPGGRTVPRSSPQGSQG